MCGTFETMQSFITYYSESKRIRVYSNLLHNYPATVVAAFVSCLLNLGNNLQETSTMASEKEAALAAAPSDAPTIFDKIINKEIPSTIVYEDEKVLAFRDINPQAPTHIIIIPKVKDGLTGLAKAEEKHCEILGRLLYTAKLVAKQEGLDEGFRVVINDGQQGCQSVYHLHVHLLGGRQMNWPPG